MRVRRTVHVDVNDGPRQVATRLELLDQGLYVACCRHRCRRVLLPFEGLKLDLELVGTLGDELVALLLSLEEAGPLQAV